MVVDKEDLVREEGDEDHGMDFPLNSQPPDAVPDGGKTHLISTTLTSPCSRGGLATNSFFTVSFL